MNKKLVLILLVVSLGQVAIGSEVLFNLSCASGPQDSMQRLILTNINLDNDPHSTAAMMDFTDFKLIDQSSSLYKNDDFETLPIDLRNKFDAGVGDVHIWLGRLGGTEGASQVQEISIGLNVLPTQNGSAREWVQKQLEAQNTASFAITRMITTFDVGMKDTTGGSCVFTPAVNAVIPE